jgi:hypothetical protein
MLHCDVRPHRKRQETYRFAAAAKCNDFPSRLCYNVWASWLHTGVEFMNKLVEIRSQEFICRERALLDSERRTFWLAQAEEWEQRALDEIAYHFRECNLAANEPATTSH